MPISTITYSDKSDINVNSSVPSTNKVQATDMNEIKSVVNNNADVMNGLKGTILWTNPSPNNNFAATQITLSSGDYDFLEIYYYEWSGDSYSWKDLKCAKVIKGYTTVLEAIISYNGKGFIGARRVRYTNATNLQIDTCYSLIIDSAFLTTPTDAFCVPLYVIGYKTELF